MVGRPFHLLSEREAEVLHRLHELRTIDAVANRLDVSRNTVRTHLARARLKLGAASSTQAAAWLSDATCHPSETSPVRTITSGSFFANMDAVGSGSIPGVREVTHPFVHGPTPTLSEGGRRVMRESFAAWLRGSVHIAVGIVALVAIAIVVMRLLPKILAWNTFIVK